MPAGEPALGRFAQADTLIPGAGNPLAWDRYAYGYDNPVRYTDPSGHIACSNKFVAEGNCSDLSTREILGIYYGVTLVGDGWTRERISAVYQAALAVGRAFARQIGSTPGEAYGSVYEHMTIEWGNCPECKGGGGYTYSAHLIRFESLSDISAQRRVNNVIHEFGHAFDWAVASKPGEQSMPRRVLERYWMNHPLPRRETPYTRKDHNYYGLAGPRNQRIWHQNPSGAASEEFADTFLAWVKGAWETFPDGGYTPDAQQRMDFINPLMTTWLEYFK